MPYLRKGLQISKGNDFFVDKKLNGLLLPVVHIAVQLIGVHSWSTQIKRVRCSEEEKTVGGNKGFGVLNSGPTSSELETNALLFLIDLLRRLPVATVVLHHGPALVHQLLLTQTLLS